MNTVIPATGSSLPQQRTFDCPWCGAISPVPSDHLGEHFTCPECNTGTKLTEKNTSTLGPTEAPPDAPHLSGDRTFDCPWCGAISAVPSSHLGERFVCPECQRDTKLTALNTRRAPITAPPPDAPPPAPAGVGLGRAAIAVGLAAAVVVAVVLASRGGDQDEAKAATTHEPTTASETPRSTPASATRPAAPASAPAIPTAAARPTPPATAAAATPAAAPATPTVAKTDDATLAREAADAALTDALSHRLVARGALAKAELAIREWEAAHASAVAAGVTAESLRAVGAEAARLRAAKALGDDPSRPTAEAARAFDDAVVAFVSKDPARVAAVEAVLARMRGDAFGRAVAGLSWSSIEFHGDAFARAASAVEKDASAAATALPGALVAAREAAARSLADAEARVGAAQAKVDSLRAAPASAPK